MTSPGRAARGEMRPTSPWRHRLRLLIIAVATLWPVLHLATGALAQNRPEAPEGATGSQTRQRVVARQHLVVAAHPLAARAGRDILRAGGSAVDAAIAVQLVLGLVEPQSSGLGGGSFLVLWDAASRAVLTYDGRETAPAAAHPERFLVGGKPMPFETAVRSGLSVGTPGTVRLMALAHRRHGKLPWADLFQPAIRLAEDGFPVSPRLNRLLGGERGTDFAPEARRYFFDASSRPWPVGHLLRNPAYAATLRLIARDGEQAFYEGPIAVEITTAVIGAPSARGDITLEDMAGYRAKERPPICVPYRNHRVCGMGPPSCGAITIGQALMLLEGFPSVHGPAAAMRADAMHLITEATRLAIADRNVYIGDPDVVPVPAGLLDAGYMTTRRSLINPSAALPKVIPGLPPGLPRQTFADDTTIEAAGTTHLSIVDGAGNAVAMTSSIEAGFGSRLWAAGFLLNNQLTDFAFQPRGSGGRPAANAVAPGKRPRSSMAPTIVLDDKGTPVFVTGSPGGTRIIAYVLKSLVALIDWQIDAQGTAELANFGSRGGGLELEPPIAPVDSLGGFLRRAEQWNRILGYATRLKPYGHTHSYPAMTSGLHIIVRRADQRLEGGVDPRRDGAALGD